MIILKNNQTKMCRTCKECKNHIYCHGPATHSNYCYGCYVLVNNIPIDEYKKDKKGRFFPKGSIVHDDY